MSDFMGKGEAQPIFFAVILVNILVDTDSFEILREEAIDVDLLEKMKDGDRAESQVKLDDLDNGDGKEVGRNYMSVSEFLGPVPDLWPCQSRRLNVGHGAVRHQLRLIFFMSASSSL